MRYLKNIKEAFVHKWSKNDNLILPIWGVTENDIFDAFSDLEDEFDVEIKCDFLLRSPKGNLFNLKEENSEIIESYAAANFQPIIQIRVSTGDDIREVQSVLMDCIKNLDGYYLYHASKGRNHLEIQLTQDEELKEKSKYHNKSNSYFKNYSDSIKEKGFKFIVNKIFEVGDKHYIKLPESMRSNKIYLINIEKSYGLDNINMVDELYEVKKIFENINNEINSSKDFKSTSSGFEISSTNVAVTVRFLLKIEED